MEALGQTDNLLDLNPEFYTVWNYRRDILLNLYTNEVIAKEKYVELLNRDLGFVMSLLQRYPKCYWIWSHRRCCLFELVELGSVDWNYEFKTISKLLELDSRNFHGWQYRRFVVENIEKEKLDNLKKEKSDKDQPEGVDGGNDPATIALLKIQIEEFNYTTIKINNNISNFSAWHNRSKLIPKIFDLYNKLQNPSLYQPQVHALFQDTYHVLIHELELIKTGMYMDTEDTSVWLYSSWLLTDPLFTTSLKESNKYLELLQNQLKLVQELNELEKSDHVDNLDNCWCLKSIILLKGLILEELKQKGQNDEIETEIRDHLKVLIEIDPLRKGKYLDQLSEA